MKKVVKILISFILFIIGFLCMGLWPYITILLSFGLFISALLGIYAIWKKQPIKGEGDIFKDRNRLNKDQDV
jgi:hypothetical protein